MGKTQNMLCNGNDTVNMADHKNQSVWFRLLGLWANIRQQHQGRNKARKIILAKNNFREKSIILSARASYASLLN